ncbi:MAG: hypothetical protein ABIJ47_01695 [Candidatus Bathyarchaeota archaeon]
MKRVKTRRNRPRRDKGSGVSPPTRSRTPTYVDGEIRELSAPTYVDVGGRRVRVIWEDKKLGSNEGWTHFDEKNQWVGHIHVWKGAKNPDKIIAHELAEGTSGIGSQMWQERHEKIKPLEDRIYKELTKDEAKQA